MSSRGTANVLTRTTAILAATFFATSLVLSILAGIDRKPRSILDAGGRRAGARRAGGAARRTGRRRARPAARRAAARRSRRPARRCRGRSRGSSRGRATGPFAFERCEI